MSDDEDNVVDMPKKNDPVDQLISQAAADLEKSARESVKAKLKTLLQKQRELKKTLKLEEKNHQKKMEELRKETEKALAAIDAEIMDIKQDLLDGLLP